MKVNFYILTWLIGWWFVILINERSEREVKRKRYLSKSLIRRVKNSKWFNVENAIRYNLIAVRLKSSQTWWG